MVRNSEKIVKNRTRFQLGFSMGVKFSYISHMTVIKFKADTDFKFYLRFFGYPLNRHLKRRFFAMISTAFFGEIILNVLFLNSTAQNEMR